MRRPLFLLLALLALCSSSQAAMPGLSDVIDARRLLNSSIWSRVLRIDREDSGKPYPQTVYALVFEVASVLWLYMPEDGTRSLSHYVGRTQEEKAQLGTLLRDALPDLKAWQEQEDGKLPKSRSRDVPNNACFIQSLSLLDERIRKGYQTEQASLFTFYYRSGKQSRGHTVLLYSRAGSTFVVDPSDGRPECQHVEAGSTPVQIARMLSQGREVIKTRELPMQSYLKGGIGEFLAAKKTLPESEKAKGEVLGRLSWAEPRVPQNSGTLSEAALLAGRGIQSPSTAKPNRPREFSEPL